MAVAFADSITFKFLEWSGDIGKWKKAAIAVRWTDDTQDPKGTYMMLDPNSPYLNKVNGAGRIFRVDGSKDASILSTWLWEENTPTVERQWEGERVIKERF